MCVCFFQAKVSLGAEAWLIGGININDKKRHIPDMKGQIFNMTINNWLCLFSVYMYDTYIYIYIHIS